MMESLGCIQLHASVTFFITPVRLPPSTPAYCPALGLLMLSTREARTTKTCGLREPLGVLLPIQQMSPMHPLVL